MLLVVAVVLWVVPSSEYIFLPDRAHPVAPLVTVEGGRDPTRGGIYFVDVIVRKATILETALRRAARRGRPLPGERDRPTRDEQRAADEIDLEDMRLSQQTAAAVALRAVGRKVVVRAIGARVEDVEPGCRQWASSSPTT